MVELDKRLLDVIEQDYGYINSTEEILDKRYVYIHYLRLDSYKLNRLLDFGKIVSILYHINDKTGELTYCVCVELV